MQTNSRKVREKAPSGLKFISAFDGEPNKKKLTCKANIISIEIILSNSMFDSLCFIRIGFISFCKDIIIWQKEFFNKEKN